MGTLTKAAARPVDDLSAAAAEASRLRSLAWAAWERSNELPHSADPDGVLEALTTVLMERLAGLEEALARLDIQTKA